MHTGIDGSFCTITFSHFGMPSFLNVVLIEEFEKTRAHNQAILWMRQ